MAEPAFNWDSLLPEPGEEVRDQLGNRIQIKKGIAEGKDIQKLGTGQNAELLIIDKISSPQDKIKLELSRLAYGGQQESIAKSREWNTLKVKFLPQAGRILLSGKIDTITDGWKTEETGKVRLVSVSGKTIRHENSFGREEAPSGGARGFASLNVDDFFSLRPGEILFAGKDIEVLETYPAILRWSKRESHCHRIPNSLKGFRISTGFLAQNHRSNIPHLVLSVDRQKVFMHYLVSLTKTGVNFDPVDSRIPLTKSASFCTNSYGTKLACVEDKDANHRQRVVVLSVDQPKKTLLDLHLDPGVEVLDQALNPSGDLICLAVKDVHSSNYSLRAYHVPTIFKQKSLSQSVMHFVMPDKVSLVKFDSERSLYVAYGRDPSLVDEISLIDV